MFAILAACAHVCVCLLGMQKSLKKGVSEPSSGFFSLMKNRTDNRKTLLIHANVQCYKNSFPPFYGHTIKCNDPINTHRHKHAIL